jgi:hypothetical protein
MTGSTRPAFVAVTISLAAAIALAAVVILSSGTAAATQVATPSATPVEEQSLPRWQGRWHSEGDPQFEPRTGAAVAVDPYRRNGVVLWGGVADDGRLLNDGILIDPRRPRRSRVLPEAPLVPRRDFAWASLYGRVYVWGGMDQAGMPLGDGAVFHRTWTAMPASPLPPGPASMVAVDDLLWVVATDPETGLARVASFDGDRWGTAVDVPLPVGERHDVVGCCEWSPTALTIISRRSDGFATAVAWDIGSVRYPGGVGGGWTQLGEVPVPPLPGAGPAVGYALEQDLVAWAGGSDEPWPEAGSTGTFAALLDPREPVDGFSLSSPAPEGVGADPTLVLSPRHLISLGAMAAYDLADDGWLSLPSPGRSEMSVGATAWWDSGKLWVFGGQTPDGSMESKLRTFEPKLPKGTYALPIGDMTLWGGGDRCYVVAKPRTIWRLRGDPQDPALVWLQRGQHRVDLEWPDGWTVRFDPKLTVVDTTGTVRFREGDRCVGDTGTGG